MTLANAQPHKVYTVIRTDGEIAIRLAELGFAEGSTVIVTGVSLMLLFIDRKSVV